VQGSVRQPASGKVANSSWRTLLSANEAGTRRNRLPRKALGVNKPGRAATCETYVQTPRQSSRHRSPRFAARRHRPGRLPGWHPGLLTVHVLHCHAPYNERGCARRRWAEGGTLLRLTWRDCAGCFGVVDGPKTTRLRSGGCPLASRILQGAFPQSCILNDQSQQAQSAAHRRGHESWQGELPGLSALWQLISSCRPPIRSQAVAEPASSLMAHSADVAMQMSSAQRIRASTSAHCIGCLHADVLQPTP
jgi:hypothetical protein